MSGALPRWRVHFGRDPHAGPPIRALEVRAGEPAMAALEALDAARRAGLDPWQGTSGRYARARVVDPAAGVEEVYVLERRTCSIGTYRSRESAPVRAAFPDARDVEAAAAGAEGDARDDARRMRP